jgi:hypothetical protein
LKETGNVGKGTIQSLIEENRKVGKGKKPILIE